MNCASSISTSPKSSASSDLQSSVVPLAQLPSEWSWKEKLAYLTVKFLEFPQTECPMEHRFENGHYYRTMRIPAGTLFIGRPHKVGHEVQLLEGQVALLYPTHQEIHTAYDSMHTVPGYQTVFHALTDVLGRTVHPDTGERDLDKREAEIFEPVDELIALGHTVRKRLT